MDGSFFIAIMLWLDWDFTILYLFCSPQWEEKRQTLPISWVVNRDECKWHHSRTWGPLRWGWGDSETSWRFMLHSFTTRRYDDVEDSLYFMFLPVMCLIFQLLVDNTFWVSLKPEYGGSFFRLAIERFRGLNPFQGISSAGVSTKKFLYM